MSQAPPFRLDRRRKRPFGDDSSSYLTSFLCCDIVNRMREDINCLCQDAKRMAKLKTEMENQKRKFEVVCAGVKYKLKNMAPLKFKQPHSASLTEMKALETRDLLKYTWSLTNSSLDKRAQTRKFMSIRGVQAVEYIKELIEMSEFIQQNYGSDFQHVECSALYTHLSRQLQCLLAPEMLKGDAIEFSANYINNALPSMLHMMSIVDLYIQSPKIVDVIGLTNEIFFKSPIASSRPCKSASIRALTSLLRGCFTGEDPVKSTVPTVESRIKRFYQLGAELAQHILEVSAVTTEPPAPVPQVLLGSGLLDPRFLNALPVKNVHEQDQAAAVLPFSSLPKILPSRGRGRPRKRTAGAADCSNETNPLPVRRTSL